MSHLTEMQRPCPLSSCRLCTPCATNRHDECRREVRCPNDGQVRACSCCGVKA